MIWRLVERGDARARRLADRHYNRRSVGATLFAPPGRVVVLLADDAQAFWVTSWQYARYVKHAWPNAWVCSAFRNETPQRVRDGKVLRSSDLIREAVAATRWRLGPPPDAGMITFVDASKVRAKQDPGFCYLRAGFTRCGETAGGLLALQMLPQDMPAAEPPLGVQHALFTSDKETA